MIDRTNPRKALDALSSEHGIPILRFLRGRGWSLASQVAEALGIHTTTASKHLAEFSAAGIVERKPHRSRRPTYAYRLHSTLVRIEFDIGSGTETPDVTQAAEAFADSLLDAAEKVGGVRLRGDLTGDLFGGENWRETLRARLAQTTNPRLFLENLVRQAQQQCAHRLGRAAGGRLFQIALHHASEGRDGIFPAPEVGL